MEASRAFSVRYWSMMISCTLAVLFGFVHVQLLKDVRGAVFDGGVIHRLHVL